MLSKDIDNLVKINLQDNTKLSTLTWKDEKDWLELRKKGIGGSDIGALMGLNKYSSPLKIYKVKHDNFEENLDDNVFIKKGKDLEPFILANFVRPMMAKSGYVCYKPDFMIINSDCPWLRANIDGMAFRTGKPYTDNIGIEIKWVSQFAEVNWNGAEYNGVPASYYAQVQLYMAVTGLTRWKLFALFDSSWECIEYNIPRDEMFIMQLLAVSSKFYSYNLAMGIPPKPVLSLDKEEVVKEAKKEYPRKCVSAEATELVNKYKEIDAEAKRLSKEADKLKDLIYDKFLEGEWPDDGKTTLKLTTVTSHKFNQAKFKAEKPELFEQYCTDEESSRFTIK